MNSIQPYRLPYRFVNKKSLQINEPYNLTALQVRAHGKVYFFIAFLVFFIFFYGVNKPVSL